MTIADHEAHLRKLNRTYALLSAVNQTIVRVREPQALFEATCRIAVEQGGYRMAWVGLLEPQTLRIHPVAHAGQTGEYLDKLALTLDDSERGRGPTATALRAGKHVIENEIEGDPGKAPGRADALTPGFRASAAFPLMVADNVRGTLNLYASEQDAFDDDEMQVLDKVAADIAFALEFMEHEDRRRRAESELRASKEQYHTLARISPVGIFRTDPNGSTTYVNPKWCEISGLSFEQALGDGWLDAVHPDDRAGLGQGWQASAQQHLASFSNYRMMRADGTIAWVTGQAVPELDAESQVVGYVGTLTDITEQKRGEQELRRRANEFASLYEIAREVTAQSDLSAVLEIVSARAVHLLHTSDAIIYLYDAVQDELELAAASRYSLPRGTRLRVGEGVSSEVVRTRKSLIVDDYRTWNQRRPELEPLDLRAIAQVPLIFRDEVIGVLGIAEIGTDRKFTPADTRLLELLASQAAIAISSARLYAALEAYNKELEQRVAERTEDLNAALVRAQQADHLKSVFLATMSHELRTPLNSIIGFTGVLLQGMAGPLNAEQTKQLGMTRDSGRHLLALINDVLDISKIEAGQLQVELAPFEMRAAIEDTLRTVSPLAHKKGLELTAAIGSTVGVVVSDRRRVEQILLNLLSNAIKFTERGQVQLECHTREGWLEIAVHDTGIGIHPEDMHKLFEPFHQLETGLNRRHEGTGLGLAICKNLVNLLGGQISARSEWGAGSTFTFTLPPGQQGAPHGEHPHH